VLVAPPWHEVSKSDTRRHYRTEHLFTYGGAVADLPIPELVENRRRSIAMLPTGAPALNREEALEVFRQLGDALRELQRRDAAG
jgi:hypothetical protein